MVEHLLFYVFSSLLIFSALVVVFIRNPIHSALYLIYAFFNAAALFLLLGAELLAMLLIIVYVGAVAVLFLFVVMTDTIFIDSKSIKNQFMVGIPLGATLFIEMMMLVFYWKPSEKVYVIPKITQGLSNTKAIASVLYTDYVFIFQVSGLILLVAMIGAMTLTLRKRSTLKHQSIKSQLQRNKENSLEMITVNSGEGLPERFLSK